VTRLEFITAIMPACIGAEKASGIPRGWFAAQAIQESGGYGKSDLSINANNLYGIKGDEYYQGKVGYAKFASWDECIKFQAWQLSVPRYGVHKPLVQAGDYRAYGDAIQKAGYCAPSNPTYGAMIASIAATYNLYPPPKPSGAPTLSVAQKWAVESGIVNEPCDFTKTVDMNIAVWLLYKSRGKLA
jgi:flagellum-specific peptidoglycan hydrolase FlgJ